MGSTAGTRQSPKASSDLERGRKCFAKGAWGDAYRHLAAADGLTPLSGDDLEMLALSAALTGHDQAMLGALERAHHAHLDAGDAARAARAAFWIGVRLISSGEAGRASGWFARAERVVERVGQDCVERGYLLLPAVQRLINAGDYVAAEAMAATAAEIGERFHEADLMAFARHLEGKSLIRQGRVARGLALLDEAMVAVAAGELSPIITGLIYCSVIAGCQQVFALDRAREWTTALADWCAGQPQLVTFTGTCLVHRAEIMQLNGAWKEALEEAQRATEGVDRQAAGAALYQQGEVHRMKGEFAAADKAYRGASQFGVEPQPGLALLQLAEGRSEAAVTTIRRVLGATTDRMQRIRLLPATVEIMLAAGELDEAREACRELEAIGDSLDAPVLGAMAAHARGAVALAEDNPQAALAPLRRAFEVWHEAGAPFIAARLRVLIGLACRALGDDEGARLEFDAAHRVFAELGARPELERIESLEESTASKQSGLTRRELQVLRLVAAGKTNRTIADELCLSEKTIDRHVSNILVKLAVPSRTAATAYAYEHKLV